MKRIISFILIAATLAACFAVLPFGTFAKGSTTQTLRPIKSDKLVGPYLSQSYYSAADKIARDENMELMAVYGTKKLYANTYTGEVYVEDMLTGNVLHSNPYDLSNASSEKVRIENMSQVLLVYDLLTAPGGQQGKELLSWSASAVYGQINVEPIINGIRVNYALGDTTKRYLLPYGMMANELIDLLFVPMQQQLVTDMQNAAAESGVSEEDLAAEFDYEAFCTKNQASYSTIKQLGVERVYGNFSAFKQWLLNAQIFYRDFYNYTDPDEGVKRPASEQEGMIAPKDMNNLASDYEQMTTYYSLVTPYTDYKENQPDTDVAAVLKAVSEGKTPPKKEGYWTISPTAVNNFEILRQVGTHPELHTDYLCNAIFVLDQTMTIKQSREIEALFGKYVNGFTLADATAAEDATLVYPTIKESAVFYLSLEYTLAEDGFTVSVPASSIMYDESTYKINQISVLPYMGTSDFTDRNNNGFHLFPDGSGTLVEYADFRTTPSKITGDIYGQDYAYYSVTGQHQQSISMPVFGVVKNETRYKFNTPFGTSEYCTGKQYENRENESYDKRVTITYELGEDGKTLYACYPFGVKRALQLDPSQTTVDAGGLTHNVYIAYKLMPNGYYEVEHIRNTPANQTAGPNVPSYEGYVTQVRPEDFFIPEDETKTSGFFAIVEDGASLSSISTKLEPDEKNATFSAASSIGVSFAPRAEDYYSLSDVMTNSTDSSSFTVLAKNKFNGAFTTKYIMLVEDPALTPASDFEASYPGMANAYRAYLLGKGILSENCEFEDQLPLFIESFGTIQTQKKFLSIPFTVDVALTSFDDVKTMYKELSTKTEEWDSIKNVKFRLTGFNNGGMQSEYPVKLKWESASGGKSGFKDMVKYAKENAEAGFEMFPNFNFAYVLYTGTGDGISLKKIGARSVDNRYAMRKTYSSVYQTYTFSQTDGILVNSSNLTKLFEKFNKKYSKYKHNSISLELMASDLSSDFDEDNGMTREEALNKTLEMLSKVSENYSTMSDGGNVYAIQYMKYLLKAPLDSSHFTHSSRTVPFWGMVMHGHLQYAGLPFNEQPNKREALLRAIESGAALYFMLSYDNTRLMKDDIFLSDYYSVNYEFSKETVREYYDILNDAIGGLQDYHIVDHRIVNAERINLPEESTAQRRELELEFIAKLTESVLSDQDTQKTIIYELSSTAAEHCGIDRNVLLAAYDLDGNSRLDETELENAWDGMAARQDSIKKFVVKYQDSPRISEIIGGVDLTPNTIMAPTTEIETAAKLLFGAAVNGEINIEYGQTIGVSFDEDAVLASARALLCIEQLDAGFETELRTLMKEMSVNADEKNMVVKVDTVNYTPARSYFTTSDCTDSDYKITESTISDGTVVMVTYSNGTDSVSFILNFNIFAVNVSVNGEVTQYGRYDFRKLS